jgi:hypothetical protein
MVETDGARQKKGYWSKPNNYIRLFTLLAVLTYTGVQIYQTHLISGNNVVSERAFIAVAMGQIQVVNAMNPRAVNFPAFLINSGNTPTKRLRVTFRCVPSATELPEPWSLFNQNAEKVEHYPAFVGAHGTSPTGCSFSWDQIQQIVDKKLFGYLMADVSYFDRLDPTIPHRTEMDLFISQAVIISPTATNPNYGFEALWEARGQHNCADEECPAE